MLSEGGEADVVGTVLTARVDGEELVVELDLTERGDAAIAEGLRELSLGYKCRVDAGFQIGTRVDHLALVKFARCGAACAVRVDGVDETCGCAPLVEPPTAPSACACKIHAVESDHSNEEHMDELQKQLAASLAEIEKHRARADAAEQRVTAQTARADQAEGKVKSLEADIGKIEAARDNAQAEVKAEKSRADAAEAKAKADAEQVRKDSADALDARVNQRVALMTSANKVLGATDKDGKAIDRSAMSDREIKAAIVNRVDGIEVSADKPETYLDGMYEGALRRADAAQESRGQVLTTINQNRRDGASVDKAPTGRAAEEAAYEQLRRDTAEGYLSDDSDDDDGEE